MAKLRFSLLVVVLGVTACAALAAAVVDGAWKAGWDAAQQPAASTPAGATPQRATRNGATAQVASAGKPPARPARAAQATRPTVVAGGPSPEMWGALFGGIGLIGALMVAVVRRPREAVRRHAMEVSDAMLSLESSTLETFAALNATVEAKDRYTAGHGLRVTLMSLLIGQELGLDDESLDALRHAATFHDIGKIAVPDSVLQKPGRLDDQEFEVMKIHPVEGARICGKLGALKEAVPAVRHHHERFDGRGYPDGLKGVRIPLGARIIAVADTWDAITSDRPYRRGQPPTVALDEIRRVAGAQFDPRVVEAFLEVLHKDPWMFGLTPEDLANDPAAPGRDPGHFPHSLELPDTDADRGVRVVYEDEPGGDTFDDFFKRDAA